MATRKSDHRTDIPPGPRHTPAPPTEDGAAFEEIRRLRARLAQLEELHAHAEALPTGEDSLLVLDNADAFEAIYKLDDALVEHLRTGRVSDVAYDEAIDQGLSQEAAARVRDAVEDAYGRIIDTALDTYRTAQDEAIATSSNYIGRHAAEWTAESIEDDVRKASRALDLAERAFVNTFRARKSA